MKHNTTYRAKGMSYTLEMMLTKILSKMKKLDNIQTIKTTINKQRSEKFITSLIDDLK